MEDWSSSSSVPRQKFATEFDAIWAASLGVWQNRGVNDLNSQPPRGWYADPARAGQERYWDGSQWTQVVRGTTTIEPKKGFTPRSTESDPALDLPLAGWLRRFGSGVIDTVVSWVLFAVVLAVGAPKYVNRWYTLYLQYGREVLSAMGKGIPEPAAALTNATTTLMLGFGGITALYTIIMLGISGATLGHRAMGVKVVKAPIPQRWVMGAQPKFTVEKPGWMRSISKGLGWALFSTATSWLMVIQLLNVLMPLWHRRKQSVTDIFASTLLIRNQKDDHSHT